MIIKAELFEGRIDIVGDVHGELDCLIALLVRLGYNPWTGRHPEGRRLVFVGDLVDRGPNSPGVVELVRDLVRAGIAQCILGNHELNILRGEEKTGNHWFYDKTGGNRLETYPRHDEEDGAHDGCFVSYPYLSDRERDEFRAFAEDLPLVLENSDLRVVHACWSAAGVRQLEEQAAGMSVAEAFAFFDRQVASAHSDPVRGDQGAAGDPIDVEQAHYEAALQNGNPLRCLLTGPEEPAPRKYEANGKIRDCRRSKWWEKEEYRSEIPVVFGHYWREYDQGAGSDPMSPLCDEAPFAWLPAASPLAFCIDYSIGRRYLHRHLSPSRRFKLAALRWPERSLVFHDGSPV